MAKIIFLVSGNGGNLKFFFKSLSFFKISDIDIFVIADRECGAIVFADRSSIPHAVISYNRDNNKALLMKLSEIKPDVIVTNWHKIIDKETISLFRGKLINLHYSLLPAFGGLIGTAPIAKAFDLGCKYVGATCHHVDEGVDTGRIIAQTAMKMDGELDRAIEQVFRNGCLILFSTIIEFLSLNPFDGKKNRSEGFSPDLLFDESVFDDNFWDELSKT